MAKFIKSFFHPSEKKLISKGQLDEDVAPPLDDRRKLSISRSGRMKHANKKRRSLCLDLYGEEENHQEKVTSTEYHVHGRQFTANTAPTEPSANKQPKKPETGPSVTVRRQTLQPASPEEEIDSAFEILDKT